MTRAERIAIGSIGIGCLVLVLKGAAWWITGSAAFYSDALETTVNVAAGAIALYAIHLAAKPADADHPYGHDKAEFFAAVIEGVLIVIAAISIFREAWREILDAARAYAQRGCLRAQPRGNRAQRAVVGALAARRQASTLGCPRRRFPPPDE